MGSIATIHAKPAFLGARRLPILNQNHQLLPYHDLRRPSTSMSFRRSFSKPFKKLKGKLRGGSSERDGRSGSEDSRRGSEDSRKGRKADIKGGVIGQRNPYLHSEVSVEGAAGGGPSGEGSGVNRKKVALIDTDPHTSTPSILHIGKPDGM